MTASEVRTAILNGSFDDDLPALIDSMRERQKRAAKSAKPGDVFLLQGLSPKYLNGCRFEITVDPFRRSGSTRISDKLLDGAGSRFPVGYMTAILPQCLGQKVA